MRCESGRSQPIIYRFYMLGGEILFVHSEFIVSFVGAIPRQRPRLLRTTKRRSCTHRPPKLGLQAHSTIQHQARLSRARRWVN